VSGTIGDAALGLALQMEPEAPWVRELDEDQRAFLIERYRHPQARLALAPVLLANADAAMDVSDGLAGDLAKMMRASGTTAEVETAAVPLSDAARAALAADPKLIERILTGGDDYEILCCVPAERLAASKADAIAAGVSVTAIGTVLAGEGLPVFRDRGRETRYERGSFSHF
jgi:thiamine-monophosphate kinase